MRDAVDLLLKAGGYIDFCLNNVLPRLPPDMKYVKLVSEHFDVFILVQLCACTITDAIIFLCIRSKLPTNLHESVLEAISNQALAQVDTKQNLFFNHELMLKEQKKI